MKVMQNFLMPLIVLVIFSLIGCAGKPVKVGLSSQQVESADIDYSQGRSISATASGFQLLLFIPISVNDRHARAYKVLQEKAGNDYISEVKIQESWTYAFVGTIYRTTLEATVYPRISNEN